jgi:ABC-type proline/glycine betaine transport system ATPase subunit
MITFDNVSIVFGSEPNKALPLMDAGKAARKYKKQLAKFWVCTIAA